MKEIVVSEGTTHEVSTSTSAQTSEIGKKVPPFYFFPGRFTVSIEIWSDDVVRSVSSHHGAVIEETVC
jgi:hypothetical protein